jgi:hypothetical protein
MLLDWLRVKYGIEKPSNKHLAMTQLDFDIWVGRLGCRSGCEERLLFRFPLSSTAEERRMTFSNGLPRVALADSLTRGYFLKPLRDFRDGVWNSPAPLNPPAP